jgi:hypothetical protein
MRILGDSIKATESYVFARDQFDIWYNMDIEGTCPNPQSTVTYVATLHSGLKNIKALP